MTNKQRISEYGPEFFEQIFSTTLDGVGSVRVHIIYEVGCDDSISVSDYVLFTANRERNFTSLPYNAQLQLLSDIAHESDNHVTFYRQEMLDFEAQACSERRRMSSNESYLQR